MFKDKTYQKMIQDYGHIFEEKIAPKLKQYEDFATKIYNEIFKPIKMYWWNVIVIVALFSITVIDYHIAAFLWCICMFVYMHVFNYSYLMLVLNMLIGLLVVGDVIFFEGTSLSFSSQIYPLSVIICFVLLLMGLITYSSYIRKFKELKLSIKKNTMPYLIESLGNVVYSPKSASKIISKELLEKHNISVFQFSSDDVFYGNRNGVDFEIVEFSNGKLFICFQGNKKVSERIVITTEKDYILKNKLSLEDIEFNKQYHVYSNDEVAARYVLTPSFIERFKQLELDFLAKNITCSINENDIIFIINYRDDLFEIFDVKTKTINKENVENVFRQLSSIMLMIDHFKLDEKTGL